MRPGWASQGMRLLAALLLLVALTACGQLDQDQLKNQVESLQSLAQEGILIAQAVADGRAHSPYVKVHAEEMASAASDVGDSLGSQTAPPELRTKKTEAVAFARQISDQLQKLSDHPDDGKAASSVASALKAEAQRIQNAFGSEQ